jgi:hypothetical protein
MIEDYNCKVIDIEARFGNEEEHDSLCVAMFRSVLTPYVYKYDDEIMWDSFTQNLVVQTLDSVPGLRTLYLPYAAHINQSAHLARMIRHLKQLQVFAYRFGYTDEIIEQLALHCPHLKKISFSGSRRLNSDSIHHLLQLKELQFVYVDRTQIADKYYGLLLSKLPQIRNIKFMPKERNILDYNVVGNLDKISHVSGYVENIEMLTQRCPNITNLDITTIIGDLSSLAVLTSLRTVRISRTDYVTSNVNAVLTGVGRRLTELALTWVTRVNLQDIVTLCPSLKILAVRRSFYLPLNVDAPLDPQLPHFRNLISLSINMSRRDEMNYNYIRYYVNLKRIRLLSTSIGFMRGVLNSGAFANLEEFEILEYGSGTMTMEAVQLLIQSCSRLKRIRGLETCKRIRRSFIQELKRRFLVQNLDVEITLRQKFDPFFH